MKILDYTCPICKKKERFILSNWEIFGIFSDDFCEEYDLNFLKWYMNMYDGKPIVEPSKFIALMHLGHTWIPFTRVCIDCELFYNDDFVEEYINVGNKKSYMISYREYMKNHPGDLYCYIKPYYFCRDIGNYYSADSELKVVEWEKYNKWIDKELSYA